MARVRGPLFSLAASGSIGRRLTYRVTPHGAIAQTYSTPGTPPTADQLAERQSLRDAAAAWAALDDNDRQIWATPDFPTTRHAFMSFFLEWKTQRIQAGGVPLIPARYLGIPSHPDWPIPPAPVFLGTFAMHWDHMRTGTVTPAPTPAPTYGAHFVGRKYLGAAPPPAARGTTWMVPPIAALYGHTPPSHNRGTLRAHNPAGVRHKRTDAPKPRLHAHLMTWARHDLVAAPLGKNRGSKWYIGRSRTLAFFTPPSHDRGTKQTHGIHGRLRKA